MDEGERGESVGRILLQALDWSEGHTLALSAVTLSLRETTYDSRPDYGRLVP
jgi:hypothetical protein